MLTVIDLKSLEHGCVNQLKETSHSTQRNYISCICVYMAHIVCIHIVYIKSYRWNNYLLQSLKPLPFILNSAPFTLSGNNLCSCESPLDGFPILIILASVNVRLQTSGAGFDSHFNKRKYYCMRVSPVGADLEMMELRMFFDAKVAHNWISINDNLSALQYGRGAFCLVIASGNC